MSTATNSSAKEAVAICKGILYSVTLSPMQREAGKYTRP